MDAARSAASSLNVRLAEASVVDKMNQFNSNVFKKFADPKAEHNLTMYLSYSPAVAIKTQAPTPQPTRYVKVQVQGSIAPLGLPIEFKVAPSAECALEYPEGWTNENENARRI